jgi:hypothetical protein
LGSVETSCVTQRIGRCVVASEPECLGGMLTRAPQTAGERYMLAVESIKRLGALTPWPDCNPEGWDSDKEQLVSKLRQLDDIEAIRNSALAFPGDFSQWRTHCHDLEAKNAARLQVLVWILQTLYSLRHDEEIAPVASSMADKVADALEQRWNVPTHEIPITGPYRDWCSKVTRNYRMLPKAWRYV